MGNYIGQEPVNTFSQVPTKDSFTGDGSTTTFDLSNAVVSSGENALEVFVNNVRQEPGSGKAFTLGVDGSNELKRITFSAAPASGASIYVINDKTSSTSVITPSDLNGVELILDADGDTSITADTDDRIDFKIASTDHIQLGTSSGDTTIKIATDAKDLQFLQADGNKLLEINDGNFVGVGGNSTAAGEVRIFEDTDNGSNYVGLSVGNVSTSYTLVFPNADGSSGQAMVTNGSGVLTFTDVSSAADDITAGDAAINLTTTSGNITIDAQGNDTDIIFKGTDGSADTTFLTLDGSAAGAASFNGAITANAGVVIDNITIDGTEIDLSSGDLTLDVAGDIVLDADGADVIFKDDGTEYGRVTNSSTDFVIQTAVSDKDFVIKGNDGGSTITPFTIDMSAGGDLFLTGGLIDLKNDGSAVSQIKFYCESSNAHAQTLRGAPHSESASNSLTLPSTGGDAKLVSVSSTATLTNKTLTTPRIVDDGYVQFGTDNEVRLISNPDKGVILKHTATADDKPVVLTLQTGETDMAANDVMGKIEFQAPDEGTGTDAILVAAAIQAKSEGDFSSSSNATSLEFMTGASEAATAKVKITSAGHLMPTADDSYDLGGASNQWRNVYTGDLHLSNMTKDIGNIVDGSKGDWTIQEGSEDLFLINNNSGKKYKFNLTEV